VKELSTFLSSRADFPPGREEARDRLDDRLGLNVPYEWWPRAAALKAIEATGFRWIQVASPPVEMLAEPRDVVRHAQALRASLDVTDLRTVVHGPPDLRLGSALHDRAGEGLLEYAHQLGASHVVYHALDLARLGDESEAEEQSLKRLTRWAEALRVLVCVENLCPTYPGPRRVCHDPGAVRELVLRLDSPSVRMLFDVGHANVIADSEGIDIASLLEPALEVVALFHVHDNLGARRREGGGFTYDPLRLDLHLPPGIGTLAWESIASALLAHGAPLVMEIHPSHRPPAPALHDAVRAVVLSEPATADVAILEAAPNAIA
jgi:sugar phosphate isomerase/epimerase